MSISSEITRINTNISNAYTAVGNKGGTLPVTQNSANLATAIDSITTGGGSVSVQEKDINFYDYDGTLLHSYTLAEVQELTELPELPTQQGLICQGWNWTLADLKVEGKPTDVGATYITDDGKTRLYIHIATDGRMNVPLYFRQSVEYGVEVDWGDNSQPETFSGSGSSNITPIHQYSTIGDYVITLNPINNCELTLGIDDSNYCIVGRFSNASGIYKNMLIKAEIGKNVINISTSAFMYCFSLLYITIPKEVTNISYYSFWGCYNLLSIIIPKEITTINAYMLNSCYSLKKAIMPSRLTTISSYAFQGCYSLPIITIPNRVTSISGSNFQNCFSLLKVTIPTGITTINGYMFQSCKSLSKIVMPNTITRINATVFSGCESLTKITIPSQLSYINSEAFAYCFGVGIYDFSNCSSIPTLGGSSAFSGISSDCKIVVPDSLYNDWISASNWSTYSSYIVKASEV